MIGIRNLKKSFGEKIVLDGVSFDIPPRSVTTLFGPNGCGKSTLINILTGLDKADGGDIKSDKPLAGRIGYVFQDYRRSLLPWATVRQNILFPLSLRGMTRREQYRCLIRLIELAGVTLNLDQPVYSLSGGQAQLVCILRALIIEPKLLLLDEPFAALDYERTLMLRGKLSELCERLQLTVLIVSHDLEEALMLGDRVVFLSRAPTHTHAVLPVTLVHPRTPEIVVNPGFIELKQISLRLFGECVAS